MAAAEFTQIAIENKHSIVPVVYQEKGYLIWFDPLESYEHKSVGYIIAYIKDQHLVELHNEFRFVLILIAAASALVTATIVFFVYRTRVQHYLLVKNANTDRLTQIANRAFMILQLDHMIKNSRRNGSALSVIFFDIDHFKMINDAYGHRAGDQALVELSSLMNMRLRESDVIGRWGGEEFVIILPDTALNEAIALAETLRLMIEGHHFEHGKMTCSFGIAQMIDEDTEETLIHRADAMLYVAKENGRNQVRPKKD